MAWKMKVVGMSMLAPPSSLNMQQVCGAVKIWTHSIGRGRLEAYPLAIRRGKRRRQIVVNTGYEKTMWERILSVTTVDEVLFRRSAGIAQVTS